MLLHKGINMKVNWRRLTNPDSKVKKLQSDNFKERPQKNRKYNRNNFDLNKYLNNLKPDKF